MAFKLLTHDAARAFGLQIVNAYRQGHDIPIVGSGIKLPVSLPRQKNRTRQSSYKAKTPRLTIWLTSDYEGITDGLVQKIADIGQAKKQWRGALGTLHRHQRELAGFQNRTISRVITATNTLARIEARIAFREAAIRRLTAAIISDQIDVNTFYVAYQAAIDA